MPINLPVTHCSLLMSMRIQQLCLRLIILTFWSPSFQISRRGEKSAKDTEKWAGRLIRITCPSLSRQCVWAMTGALIKHYILLKCKWIAQTSLFPCSCELSIPLIERVHGLLLAEFLSVMDNSLLY